MSKCIQCEKDLTPLDMSLTMKLISRCAVSYYCKKCLAQIFSTTEEKLDQMAEQFKAQGCSLFL